MEFDTELMNDWNKWKETLHNAVTVGKKVGISDDTMANMASKIGDILANNVDPENREQRLLKELWDNGDDEERKAMANVIVKMVK